MNEQTGSVHRERQHTVGKLISVLADHAENHKGKAFAGRVVYRPTAVLEKAAARVRARDVKEVSRVAAQMLHMKRTAFRFEKEVRLLWIGKGGTDDPRFVVANATRLVSQVMIGPDASSAMVDKLKADLRGFGFPPSKVFRSKLYAVPARSALARAP